MIPVADVITEIRETEKDVDEVKFSDYDLLSAINKTIRLTSNQLALMNSEFTEAVADYEFEEVIEGAELPDDFISLRKVIGHHGRILRPTYNAFNAVITRRSMYFISNGKIFASQGIRLLYRKSIPKVVLGGSIDVPAFLFDFIVSTTRLVLNNAERDVLMDHIANTAKLIIPQRKYGNATTGMPFRV